MKKSILSVICLFAGIFVYAQKPVVLVDYFRHSSNVSDAGATALRNAVIEGVNLVNRVNLIDVDTESSLAIEAGRRNSELAMEDKTARMGAMKTIGANYVITGTVSNMSADYTRPDSGDPYYNGNIVYALTVVDVSNGTVVGTRNFTYSGITGNVGSSADDAIISTLGRVKLSMKNFVNEYFKLTGTVVVMNEASKKGDQAKSLYISLGSDAGVGKGQMLDVFEVKLIAGREAKTEIGSLRVEEVVAGDLSMCVVIKGGKEIMAAFRKGSEMRVLTKKDNALKNLGQGLVDSFK